MSTFTLDLYYGGMSHQRTTGDVKISLYAPPYLAALAAANLCQLNPDKHVLKCHFEVIDRETGEIKE